MKLQDKTKWGLVLGKKRRVMVLQMELSKNPSLTSRLLMNKKILKIYTYIKIDYYNVLSGSLRLVKPV